MNKSASNKKSTKIHKESAGLVKIPIKLTEKEELEKGRLAGLLRKEGDEASVVLAEYKKNMKAKIADLYRRMNEHLSDITDGVEAREVECEWHYDFQQNTKRLVRLDNSQVVEKDQTLTEDERQMLIDTSEDPS